MDKILVLLCVFILNTCGQQIFLSKVNQNEKKVEIEPKLYLSRENPAYRQNRTIDKSKDNDEDIKEMYTREILGLSKQPRRIGIHSRKPEVISVPTLGGRAIQMSENSPLYRYFKTNQPESPRKNNNQESDTILPVGEYVLKKTSPTILENGTLILGGYKIENPLQNMNINSFRIKNIKIEDHEPIIKRVSTIKFNGELVTPEFLEKYFSQMFNIFNNDAETSASSPAKFEKRFDNKKYDGFGLIDVRSNF